MNATQRSALALAGLLLTPAVWAQRPGAAAARSDPGQSRFEQSAPAIGDKLPDLALYDAQGKQVRLRKIARDNYTVLVLGCLT